MNPVEKDKIAREAIAAALKELCPVLGVRTIAISSNFLQIGIEDKHYMISGVMGMSPLAIGQCVKQIVSTGTCDWDYKVKEVKTARIRKGK
jgi:hypothetical protein